jgi:YfiH family protein
VAPAWLRSCPSRGGPPVDGAGWACGWTTAAGPDFSTPADQPEHAAAVAALAAAAGLAAGAWVHQEHGDKVARATASGLVGTADALWTATRGLAVVGRSADCPLVLIAGSDAAGGGRWAFAHASWRSTVAGITTRLLAALVADGLRPDRTAAVIAPSAGPCCYAVGPEVEAAARAALGPQVAGCFPPRPDGRVFDLWRANAAALEAAGLAATRITVAGICTICGDGTYPSHRRERGRAGRFAAFSGGTA